MSRKRVRVWFGVHVIASYVAEDALAERYAAAMQRRFAGLKVTVEPIGSWTGSALPSVLLWSVPPQ